MLILEVLKCVESFLRSFWFLGLGMVVLIDGVEGLLGKKVFVDVY